jgi:hypothetical protein
MFGYENVSDTYKVVLYVGVNCNVSPTMLKKEKKVKKIIVEKSHIA